MRFQYHIHTWTEGLAGIDDPKIQKDLNDFGKLGWRLVHLHISVNDKQPIVVAYLEYSHQDE